MQIMTIRLTKYGTLNALVPFHNTTVIGEVIYREENGYYALFTARTRYPDLEIDGVTYRSIYEEWQDDKWLTQIASYKQTPPREQVEPLVEYAKQMLANPDFRGLAHRHYLKQRIEDADSSIREAQRQLSKRQAAREKLYATMREIPPLAYIYEEAEE